MTRSLEKGTLASAVLRLLTQELGELLTSKLTQGEASMASCLQERAQESSPEKGAMAEKAQPGVGVASMWEESKMKMTSALCGPSSQATQSRGAGSPPCCPHPPTATSFLAPYMG